MEQSQDSDAPARSAHGPLTLAEASAAVKPCASLPRAPSHWTRDRRGRAGLPCTTAGSTLPGLGHESFAVRCPLALGDPASYLVSVRRPGGSFPASFSTALRGVALRFPWVPVTRSPEDTHLLVAPCRAHQRERPADAPAGRPCVRAKRSTAASSRSPACRGIARCSRMARPRPRGIQRNCCCSRASPCRDRCRTGCARRSPARPG